MSDHIDLIRSAIKETFPDLRYVTERLQPGTKFEYLGRECVVLRHADELEGFHTGLFGMVYHYVDNHGVIRSGVASPRDLEAMAPHIGIIP